MTRTILVLGTWDTKSDELGFLADRIAHLGGRVLTMDVGVLGAPARPPDVTRHDVAEATGRRIDEIAALGDEHAAFQIMAAGAAATVTRLRAEGRIDGMVALGGTMGTDLALDCAQALPVGIPKVIVSTVAFSPLIPPDRIAADTTMILWAGGLYGMNALCRATLAQAAGAVWGAAVAAEPPVFDRPLIGMTSLGSSCLSYMKTLKPALEARGFDVAVFHSTGMGGMAFEQLAGQGAFACVMDFCLQEFVNMLAGSAVSSGPDRLRGAGRAGVPQIVAPGAADLLDFAGWQDIPAGYRDREFHRHNRLITSAGLRAEERVTAMAEMADRLAAATGPVAVLLPAGGVEDWDRPGGDMHAPEALSAMLDAARDACAGRVETVEVDAHINDAAFAEAALALFDRWVADGRVTSTPRARP